MTTLLNAEQIGKMRKTQDLNLPETAYIQQLTKTSDGEGGYTETWTTTATVNARIGEPKGEYEKAQAARITVDVVNVITMPAATALLDTDQVQINGINYRVHWTNRDKSHITALRAIVSKVT